MDMIILSIIKTSQLIIMLLIIWRVYPLLDNVRNTHAANNIGTVFSTSADGLLLCNARCDVTQQYVAVT
jgi:hypothetical protein